MKCIFRYLSLLTLAFLFSGQIYAMTRSEMQKTFDSRLEKIENITKEIRDLKNVEIEGRTFLTIVQKWDDEVETYKKDNEGHLYYTPKSKQDEVREHFQQVVDNEKSCRNIISVQSGNSARNYISVFGYPDCADYTLVWGSYYHKYFLIEGDCKIYECQHSSKEGLDRHVYWHKQWCSDWDKLEAFNRNPSQAEQHVTKQYENYIYEKLDELERLAQPYLEKGLAETKQYVSDKTAADNKVLLDVKSKIKSFSCEYVLGTKDVAVGNIKLFAKKQKCKSTQRCELVVGENEKHDVGIHCRCGHKLDNHVYKFNKGVKGEDVLKTLYEHEVNM